MAEQDSGWRAMGPGAPVDAGLLRAQFLERVLSALSEQIYVFDRSGHHLFANAAALRALGLAARQVLGRRWADLGSQRELRISIDEKRRQVFDSSMPFRGRFRASDQGGPVEYEFDLAPIQDESARTLAVVAVVRDVTGHALDEALVRRLDAIQYVTDAAISVLELDPMLHELLERLRTVLRADTATVMLVTEGGESLVARASRGLEEEVRAAVGVPVGKGVSGRILSSRRPATVEDLGSVEVVSELLRARLQSLCGAPLIVHGRAIGVLHVGSATTRRFTPDDLSIVERVADRVGFAVERERLHAAEKKARQCVEAERDRLQQTLAEREQLVADVQTQRQLFGEVVECAPAGIAVLEGAQLRARLANPAFLALLEEPFSAAGIKGLALETFVPRAREGGLADALARVRDTGEPHMDAEYEHRGFSRGTVWLRYSALAIPAPEGGRDVMFLGMEITDQVLARREAEQSSAAKDRFLAMLSHELRNPLMPALMLTANLLKDSRIALDLRQDLEMVRRNIELEARLIDDLLDVTRISSGKLRLAIHTIDLNDILRATVEICRPDAADKSVLLHLELAPERLWVEADAARLQQVFWNLIKNAIKFTPAGGSIKIGSCRRDGRVLAEVTDTGIGIDPAALSEMFEPFVQGAAGVRHPSGGLGLGLSISKNLLDLLGGTIAAHSEGPGSGARFTVALAGARQLPYEQPGEHASPPAVETGPLRVLVVEDDPATRMVLTRLLAKLGHRVSEAGSVQEALEVAKAGGFELLVSDLGLPDGSGLEVMRALGPSGVRGIALSGFGAESDRSESADAGFSEHLTKPVDFDQLQLAVARVVRGS